MSKQGVDLSEKISNIKTIFWFDFHRCSHGPLKFSKIDNNKKKPSPELIFFNEKKIRKIWMTFGEEN